MRTPIGALVFAAIWLLPRLGAAQVQNSPPSVAAGIRVACFSPQRAFADSSDGKAALARLNALEIERARAVDARQKALQTQEQAYERSAPLLSLEARNQRTKELERLRIDTQRFIQDAQQELMGIQREAEAAFMVKLRPAVDKVAKNKGLQLLLNLDAGVVAWFEPSLDLTTEITREIVATR
jgi:Skp family chaperone for outer membrane proteins